MVSYPPEEYEALRQWLERDAIRTSSQPQDAATPMLQGIIGLHHDVLFFLILILVFISLILTLVYVKLQREVCIYIY